MQLAETTYEGVRVNTGAETLHAAARLYMDRRWPKAMRASDGYYADTKCTILKFLAVVRDVRLADLVIDDAVGMVQRFVDHRHQLGLSACRIDDDRRCLSAFFTWMSKERLVKFFGNPCARAFLTLPAKTIVCKPPLSDKDVETLLVATKNTRLYPSVVLCLACGLRPRGACRMRWEDFDFAAKTMTVTEKRRQRVIPMSDWACKELLDWRTSFAWLQVRPRAMMRRMAQIRVECGLPAHCTFQGLRRTFLYKLFKAGVAPQMAAAIAGNSIGVIQRHYVQFERLASHAVVNVLDFSTPGRVGS